MTKDELSPRWHRTIRRSQLDPTVSRWKAALNQFVILFAER